MLKYFTARNLLILIVVTFLDTQAKAQFLSIVSDFCTRTMIFGTDSSGQNLSFKKDFNFVSANNLVTPELVEHPNGRLYGLCGIIDTIAISSVEGGIYTFDPTTNLYHFEYALQAGEGKYPENGMILASNGLFYGTTSTGGTANRGVIFSYNPTTKVYSVVHHYLAGEVDGKKYQITEVVPGILMGNSRNGGAGAYGNIYTFNINTNTFQVKKELIYVNGVFFAGKLTKAANGKYYALTEAGGPSSKGSILEYDYTIDTLIKRKDFLSTSTSSVSDAVGYLVNGNGSTLYGSTHGGSGNFDGFLFRYDYITNAITRVLNLDTVSGDLPNGNLFMSNNGKIYSGTLHTISSDAKSLNFSFDTLTKKYTLLNTQAYKAYHHSMIQHSNGKVYGINGDDYNGSSYVQHQLYEININSDSITYVMLYGGAIRGYGSTDRLCKASNGKLYGILEQGGYNDKGIIYEYDQVNNTLSSIFDFTESIRPANLGLILAGNGKLYAGRFENYNLANQTTAIYSLNTSTMQVVSEANLNTMNMGGQALTKAANGLLYHRYNSKYYSFDPNNNALTMVYDNLNSIIGTSISEIGNGKFVYVNAGSLGMDNLALFNTGVIALWNPTSNTGDYRFNDVGNNKALGAFRTASASFGTSLIFTYDLNNNSHQEVIRFDTIGEYNNLQSDLCIKNSPGEYFALTLGGKTVALDSTLGLIKYNYTTNSATTVSSMKLVDIPQRFCLGEKMHMMWYGNGPNNLTNLEEHDQLSLYPNPSSSYIILEGNYMGSVSVVSMQGTTLGKFNKKSIKQLFDLSNLNLAKGIYLLKFKTLNVAMTTKKIVIE